MLTTTALLCFIQFPCDVLLADSVGDQIVRLTDLIPDGSISDIHEASALWRETSNRTPRTLGIRYEGGMPVLYWIDSSLDKVHRGEDINGNGDIEMFERSVLRSTGSLDGASTAQDLALTDDGAVWWCSDAGMSGLFRMRDVDGDGLYQGADELEVMAGSSGNNHPIETSVGPKNMNTRHLTEVVSFGNSVVAYGDGPDEFMSSFVDLNDDGDVLDSGESRLFLNASGKKTGVPQNADWTSGKLRNLAIPDFNGGYFYGRLSSIAVDTSGANPVWYFACDSAYGSPYDTNVDGQGLNGLIYRGTDKNGDGDLQDFGEVRLFYDGSHTSNYPEFDQILALDTCGGALYVAFLQSGERRVARCMDANGNGNAHDLNEVERYWFESSVWPNQVPFEQGPLLIQDMVALPANDFAPPNTLYKSLGPGCDYTDYGGVPTLHAIGQAKIGTNGFTVELRGAAAGSLSWFFAGDDFPYWSSFSLPVQLDFLEMPDCYLYVRPLFIKRAITTGVIGDYGAGMASHTFNIPPDPALVGGKIRMMWLIYDWFGGVAYSGGGEVDIEK